jgi:hypothetical protein
MAQSDHNFVVKNGLEVAGNTTLGGTLSPPIENMPSVKVKTNFPFDLWVPPSGKDDDDDGGGGGGGDD